MSERLRFHLDEHVSHTIAVALRRHGIDVTTSVEAELRQADHGTLVRADQAWAWRFEVFITSLSHEPWGPIGTVDVDAATGVIVNHRSQVRNVKRATVKMRAIVKTLWSPVWRPTR